MESSQILNDNRPIFRVSVEGRQQALSAILQDEVYKIGRELLRNAFRHASASRIEAEIRYSDRLFRLRIRDDGKGMDRKVLREGTVPDHWGLPGIRERAKGIGGRLTFWTEAGAGTEVELTVPARNAYARPRARRRFLLSAKNGESS
jgi:signal transduction histidine kinase